MSLEEKIEEERKALLAHQAKVEQQKEALKLAAQRSLDRLNSALAPVLAQLPRSVMRVQTSKDGYSLVVQVGDFRESGPRIVFSTGRPSSPVALLAVNKFGPDERWHLTAEGSALSAHNDELRETRREEFTKSILTDDLSEAIAWFEDRLARAVAVVQVDQAANQRIDLDAPLENGAVDSAERADRAGHALSPQLLSLITGSYPDGGYTARNGSFFPWRRYFAKTLDITLVAIVGGLVVGLLFPDINWNHPAANALSMVGSVALWAAVSPAVLGTIQTTPGRALYRIQVRTTDGGLLTMKKAYQREWLVWWRGLAIGFLPFNLLSVGLAYFRLLNKGMTSWDVAARTVVVHHDISAGRWVMIVLVVIFVTGVVPAFGILGEAMGR